MKLKILQIEDSESYGLLISHLTKSKWDITRLNSLTELFHYPVHLLNSFDVILIDGHLPDGFGMQAIAYLQEQNCHCPLVANSSDEKMNQKLIQSGAQVSFPKNWIPSHMDEIFTLCQNLL